MPQIITHLCKALGQLIMATHRQPYDHATSALLTALVDYVGQHGKPTGTELKP